MALGWLNIFMIGLLSQSASVGSRSVVVDRKTTTCDDKMILQNTFRDLRKTSEDLQRDLATARVNVDSSTVRKRLFEAGRKARSPCKKQLLTVAIKKKRLKWGKKYNIREKRNGEKLFSR